MRDGDLSDLLADVRRALARNTAVAFEPGLTSGELDRIQDSIGLRFPPDLQALLSEALPVSRDGAGFPDWRRTRPHILLEMIQRPADGLLWSVEHGGSWPSTWGERPSNTSDALAVARAKLLQAPRLIPIYGHRYLPEAPSEVGNPVFSVSGFDVVYHGRNIADYLANEFLRLPTAPRQQVGELKRIKFWSDLAES